MKEKVKTKTGTITFKKGTLRKQLKMKKGEKFTKSGLRKLSKIEDGIKFKFMNRDFKMTKLMKQRINLGITLMGMD